MTNWDMIIVNVINKKWEEEQITSPAEESSKARHSRTSFLNTAITFPETPEMCLEILNSCCWASLKGCVALYSAHLAVYRNPFANRKWPQCSDLSGDLKASLSASSVLSSKHPSHKHILFIYRPPCTQKLYVSLRGICCHLKAVRKVSWHHSCIYTISPHFAIYEDYVKKGFIYLKK